MEKKFVNLKNANRPNDKSKNYEKVIDRIEKEGVCPFCPEHLSNYHKNPIIAENFSWIATENMYPYDGAKFHFLFIHKKHVSTIEELSAKGWADLQELISTIIKEFNIDGGSVFVRFGNSNTGATVTHLHFHLVVSKGNQGSPILARIG